MDETIGRQGGNGAGPRPNGKFADPAPAAALQRELVGIKFRPEGKVYTFLAAGNEMNIDDMVLVDTDNGPVIGRVVTEVYVAVPSVEQQSLKAVIRIASDDDLKVISLNRELQEEAGLFFKDRVRQRDLPMKLVEVDCTFDRSKLIFYFSSENRIDFRDLVKDIVQKYRTKIELRQIGARQEARMIKGLGICGRGICCVTMNRQCDRVSIKMAKEQNLSLNPEKISGICGRLMCCLSYEYDAYCDLKKNVPKCNKTIETPRGRGKVIRQNVLLREAVVQLESGSEVTIPFDELASVCNHEMEDPT